jgi:uncharacterized membrane protein
MIRLAVILLALLSLACMVAIAFVLVACILRIVSEIFSNLRPPAVPIYCSPLIVTGRFGY